MPAQKRSAAERAARVAARRNSANAADKGDAAAPKKAAKQPVKASKTKRPPVVAKKPKPETPVPTAGVTEAVDLSKLSPTHLQALEIHDRIIELKGKLPTNVTRDAILNKGDDGIGGMLASLIEASAQAEWPNPDRKVQLYR